MALSILLICMGIAVTIFTSVTKHKVSVNKVLMLQEVQAFKAEMVAKNGMVEQKNSEKYRLSTDVLEKSSGITRKIRIRIRMNNQEYFEESYVNLPQ